MLKTRLKHVWTNSGEIMLYMITELS